MLAISSYLILFLSSALLSLILTRQVRSCAIRHGWVEAPCLHRHVHTAPIPRLGGVALYLSVVVFALVGLLIPGLPGVTPSVAIRYTLGILAPATIIFVLGIYDDLRGAGASLKFCVQALAGVVLYIDGNGIRQFDLFSTSHPLNALLGLPLTVAWVLLITNAFNLIDGLDGLAAGSAFFSTFVLFVISLFASNLLVTFLAIILAGAILGFLRYNFFPASIFLGDSGSLFIGFMLSALALAGSLKAPTMIAVAIPVVSLGLPILDVILAVIRRFLRRQPLFTGDREHIHHRLLKRGVPQREAVLILYAVSASFGLVSLAMLHQRESMALVLAVIGIGVCMGVQNLHYVEFAELHDFFKRTLQKRRVLANNLGVRQAAESLRSCPNLQALCKILEETLQPIGFDGVRFKTANPNLLSGHILSPLQLQQGGDLQYFWADGNGSPPDWELTLELITSVGERCGNFSLVKGNVQSSLLLDINLLTSDFRTALSDALKRSINGTPATAMSSLERVAEFAMKATSAR